MEVKDSATKIVSAIQIKTTNLTYKVFLAVWDKVTLAVTNKQAPPLEASWAATIMINNR